MMLDLVGLPKNVNGFRTTHTCELCGFEPKTKNKYREKQDHLVMKHFKERIDKIFPHCRPYSCPSGDCAFTGKDKQALLRHYTGKHGILEKYLREALAEKGINYAPSENGKRRHASPTELNGCSKISSKNPRLSLSPPGGASIMQQQQTTDDLSELINAAKPVIVASRPNTEELRKEVEAMMRSFQPVEQQQVVLQSPSVNCSSPSSVSAASMPVTLEAAVVSSSPHHHHHHQHNHNNHHQQTVVTALPSIVLSAVANATAASVAAAAASRVSVQLPTQPANVQTITVSTGGGHHQQLLQQHQHQQHQQQQQQTISVIVSKNSILQGPSPSSLPLPMEIITNGETILPDMKDGSSGPSSPVVENEDVMWSAASHSGPAVVVEAAHPTITYIDGVEAISFAAGTATMENVDYDYLYPVTTASSDVRERQLDFCTF